MSFEFHLPDLAEGMTEAEVVDWKVKVGDVVALDQPVVEVMSDKATVEIPSPRAGTIAKLNYGPGDMCAVGQVLFVINEGGDSKGLIADDRTPTTDFEDVHNAKTSSHEEPPTAKTGIFKAVDLTMMPKTVVIDATEGRTRVVATPATRRQARKLGIDISDVPGSGRNGRITTADLESYQAGNNRPGPAAVHDGFGLEAQTLVRKADQRPPIAIASEGLETRVPFRGMRKRIADNMTRSAFTATHFTYVEEVDTTDLVDVRARAKTRGEERGVKLTYLPFIVKAVVAGLKRHPSLNSSLDETTNEIVIKKYYHIGVATQGPQGLAVAVVRNADKLSIFEIADEISRLSRAIQEGTATREDLTGSTFTISSLGRLGGLMATPIINFPEVGILGVHKMEQRPAVVNNEIVIRWKMNLAISLDHRLVDGFDGAMFVQDVKGLLEDPTMMFMEMV
jgi:pyruvate dehydrogenase E2 component (dihydrolipoamide acetyltransferase)